MSAEEFDPRAQLDALEVLVASDGWALVTSAAQGRVDSYTREILSGTLAHDVYVQKSAERAAALGVIDYPHASIDRLRTLIEGDA